MLRVEADRHECRVLESVNVWQAGRVIPYRQRQTERNPLRARQGAIAPLRSKVFRRSSTARTILANDRPVVGKKTGNRQGIVRVGKQWRDLSRGHIEQRGAEFA